MKRRLKGISFRNGLRPCFRDTKEEEPEDEIAYKDEEDNVENYEKLKNPVKETPKCKKPKNNKLGLFLKNIKTRKTVTTSSSNNIITKLNSLSFCHT